MTLHIDQYLTNLISKEATISHLDIQIWGGKKSKLKADIKSKITAEGGESVLEDADYLLFFKGPAIETDDGLTKLFNTVNRALGKGANNMSQSDFKKVEEEADSEGSKKLAFVYLKVTLN